MDSKMEMAIEKVFFLYSHSLIIMTAKQIEEQYPYILNNAENLPKGYSIKKGIAQIKDSFLLELIGYKKGGVFTFPKRVMGEYCSYVCTNFVQEKVKGYFVYKEFTVLHTMSGNFIDSVSGIAVVNDTYGNLYEKVMYILKNLEKNSEEDIERLRYNSRLTKGAPEIFLTL